MKKRILSLILAALMLSSADRVLEQQRGKQQ